MNMKSFLLTCGLLMTGMLSAATATLNVDLTVTHGVCSVVEGAESRKVVFLVIDRSGSMGEATLSGDRTPNEALVDSLKLQLAAIPRGTEVHVIPFSSTIWEEQTYKCFDDKCRKAILDFVEKEAPKGQTVLYDAEDLVLSAAAKIMDRDANAEVRVLVYTDGEHLTPWNYEGEYKACYQNRTKGVGRKRFENNPNYRSDLEGAKKKFKTRFAGLISRPNLEVEYEWLSETDKPEADMVTKTPLPTELRSQTAGLANPLASPEQTVKGVLHLPISDKCWEEVKGKPISLDFEVDGKHVTEVIKLEPGRHSCKLAWPALPTDESATAKISLSRLPGGAKFELKEPKPLQWNVPAQGRVSVEVTSPAKDVVVAFGSKVSFMAKASDQADVRWAVGPSKKTLAGVSAIWTADVAGTVPYRVTASKTGFKSATASGTLEVIRTGVEVLCADSRYEVGKESVFQAKAVGPCLRYVWSVDGRRVSGEGDVLKYVFEKSGDHQVGVTAFYKNNLQADSSPKAVSVAKAPFVEILAPVAFDGDVENVAFQAEKPIDLAARVEGGLTEVVWQFKLKDKVIASIPTTVKDGRAAGRYTPPKGGYYDVIATGKGPAGEKTESVQIFVKSAEIRVDITNPKPNQDIDTGKEFVLEAVVKGPVKSVRWKMTDRSTAKPVSFGESVESAVVDGKATMTAKLPLELGNRSVTVEAEPVLADPDQADTVAPGVIVINAKTAAGIAYTSETMGLNWKKVKYGEQVKLAVTTSGAIKKVAWFTCDGSGKEVSLGKEGPAVNVDIVPVRGQSERHVDYFAKGQMPDGSWIPVEGIERITLRECCPCSFDSSLNLQIKLNESRVGRDEQVVAELTGDKDCQIAEGSIVWYLDGKKFKSGMRTLTMSFDKSQYGSHILSVGGDCKTCGRHFGATDSQATDSQYCRRTGASTETTIEVIHKDPVACFVVENPSDGGRIANPFSVKLKSTSSGDIDEYVWMRDGVEVGRGGALKVFTEMAPFGRVACRYRLVVKNEQGKTTESEEVCVKTYNLWLVLGLGVLAVACIAYVWWLYSGNDPRFWTVESVLEGKKNLSYDSIDFTMGKKVKIIDFWSKMEAEAVVPFWFLLKGIGDDQWSKGAKNGDVCLKISGMKQSRNGMKPVVVPSLGLEGGGDSVFPSVSSDHYHAKFIFHDKAHPEQACVYMKFNCLGKNRNNSHLWIRVLLTALVAGAACALSWWLAF